MYLVTGGAGFIGSNIVQTLLEMGEKVRVFDNLATGSKENLSGMIDDIEFIEGDLRDVDQVQTAAKGVEFILHQGALPSVPVSIDDPIRTNRSNINGTLNALAAARDQGVKRLVFAGSCAVYGDDPQLPKTENMKPLPKSPYALQKLAGEHYCRLFFELYKTETVALRYFNVYGRRQDPESLYSAVIPRFLEAIKSGGEPTIYGDGNQTRDFIFVKDVVSANLKACTAKNAPGCVFNVASGVQLSINEIVKALERILDRRIVPEYESERIGDVKHSVADVSFAEDVLGFKAQVPVDNGLAEYADWFLNRTIKGNEKTR